MFIMERVMSNIVVVGLQWGDEGKGKIVDWISESSDAVVRFQGGNNAGHTIVIAQTTYKLNLLPSSVLRDDKLSIVGNGVVLDPYALISEIESIQQNGIEINPKTLLLAENCCLVLSVHKQADELFEKLRGDNSIGTTHKGIGPCYEDKVGRRAIRLCDLFHEDLLIEKVDHLLNYHNLLKKGSGNQEVERHQIIKELLDIAPKILPYVKPVWKILNQLMQDKKRIVFEGAQGVLLDVDHGTYPYVTSSNTIPAQIGAGCGVNLSQKFYILGLIKAYTTRVGNGPFITEQENEIGELLFKKGKELGTVSNRKRRCGWFDVVLARQAIMLSGVSGLVMTKLDVLDYIPEIKICVVYKYNEIEYDYLPASIYMQKRLEPVYETLPGWDTSTFGKNSLNDMPENAVRYIKRLEELLGVPINLISTGPERNDIVIINQSFLDILPMSS